MLVVPALLSLKPQCVFDSCEEVVTLMEVVTEHLNDQAEIVQKTAKKLVVELNKNYGEQLLPVLSRFSSNALRKEVVLYFKSA